MTSAGWRRRGRGRGTACGRRREGVGRPRTWEAAAPGGAAAARRRRAWEARSLRHGRYHLALEGGTLVRTAGRAGEEPPRTGGAVLPPRAPRRPRVRAEGAEEPAHGCSAPARREARRPARGEVRGRAVVPLELP